jgi:ADP-heptose:LPS heptosyltransferase
LRLATLRGNKLYADAVNWHPQRKLLEMIQSRQKILMIRFSSFGDVTQSLSLPTRLAELSHLDGSGSDIHWVTRKEFAPLLQGHPFISRVWSLDRSTGFRGLLTLIRQLQKERFTHIYDAHNNLRSHLICWFLRPPLAVSRLFDPPLFARKSQKRWKRFLLFQFRINRFEMPFSGQRDLLEPLKAWGLSSELPPAPQIYLEPSSVFKVKEDLKAFLGNSSFITVAPSAAHLLKRWPVAHFKKLLEMSSAKKFVCLGGPGDSFIEELVQVDPSRILNRAGYFSLQESSAAISLSQGLITNDTGLLHVAEQLGKKTIALMGPAPFGFPSRETTQIMEIALPCRPCSKHGQGPCVNEKFHRCLVDITPEQVHKELQTWLS